MNNANKEIKIIKKSKIKESLHLNSFMNNIKINHRAKLVNNQNLT